MKIVNIIDGIVKRFRKNGGGVNVNPSNVRISSSAVFEYNFLMQLREREYEKYLKQIYFLRKGKKLNLKKPLGLNEKIQWLKLHDNLQIKTQLTDKVLARDFVKEKIGGEYLKPVLKICDNFYDIDFDKLPEQFVIKCNHGCKWQFIVLSKSELLKEESYFQLIENNINGWMARSFFGWSDFETQYKNIRPKIIIENLLRDKEDTGCEFCVYCFNSVPKIYETMLNTKMKTCCIYDENFNISPLRLINGAVYKEIAPDENLKKAVRLSEVLAKDFKFVRVDWYRYKGKLYFEEMTFTPFSGFIPFEDEKFDTDLGNMLNLRGNKNG